MSDNFPSAHSIPDPRIAPDQRIPPISDPLIESPHLMTQTPLLQTYRGFSHRIAEKRLHRAILNSL